jgi:hypothetical protein
VSLERVVGGTPLPNGLGGLMQANVILRYHRSALAAVFVALFAGSAIAQAPDPIIGVWKANLAKSTYDPGPPAKSNTTKYEMVGDKVKVTVDSVQADGTTRHYESTSAYDGKDYPITGNSPYGDTVARTRTDARTVRSVTKKAGKVTATQTSVMAADGKTRTVTTTGVNAAGQKVNNVVVYEKQ